MLTLGATDYNGALVSAYDHGYFDIVILLIKKGGSIDDFDVNAIIMLLNFGLDPKLKHISTNQYIKQKIFERQCVLTNVKGILNNCVPTDIIHHIINTYVRYK
jgi:hypothetical protein